MNLTHLKLLITLFIILHIGIGCSIFQKENPVEVLPFATGNNAYQVRVKTGNIAMDKVVYSSTYFEMGKYLKVSKTGPFIGYIDVTFKSSIKKPFRDSRPGYSINRVYGDKWYTGNSTIDHNKIPAGIKKGGMLAWQNSVMSLTIKDIKGKKKWNNVCNYKGGRDLSGYKINSADKAAKLCLKRITKQFRSDYNIKKKDEKMINK